MRVLWLTLLFVAACRHELDRVARDTGATDDTVVDQNGPRDSDASPAPAGEADGGTGDAAPPMDPFPYRWRENVPGEGEDEGYVDIALQCERAGQAVECPMRCAPDGEQPRTCGTTQRVFFAAGPHEYCVTVVAPDSDAEFRGQERTQCVPFELLPAKAPFLWAFVAPPTDATAFEIPLKCAQESAPGGTATLREDCNFECSIDHRPYGPCHNTHELTGVAPGTHELRVKTCGPRDHKYEKVCRAQLVQFTTANDAEPAVPPAPEVVLPPLLAREAFVELAPLLDHYPGYVAGCLGYPFDDGHSAQDAMAAYLSAAFRDGNGLIYLSDDDLTNCVAQLDSAPASCPVLPGLPDRDLYDLMLPVRLPSECRWVLSGMFFSAYAGFYNEPCLVHSDCLEGLCAHESKWTHVRQVTEAGETEFMRPNSYGTCGSYLETPEGVDEGILCSSSGCKAGLYCDDFCRPLKKPGEACSRYLDGADCPAGYTCDQTEPRVCVLASLKQGEACARSSECMSGYCSRGSEGSECAPRLERGATCSDPRACLSSKCDWQAKTCL